MNSSAKLRNHLILIIGKSTCKNFIKKKKNYNLIKNIWACHVIYKFSGRGNHVCYEKNHAGLLFFYSHKMQNWWTEFKLAEFNNALVGGGEGGLLRRRWVKLWLYIPLDGSWEWWGASHQVNLSRMPQKNEVLLIFKVAEVVLCLAVRFASVI